MAPEIGTDDKCHVERQPERRDTGHRWGHYDGLAVMVWKNKLTALVVEYVALYRSPEGDYLTFYGVETETAGCGVAALDLIYAGASYSLIVVDMNMLGLNGVETTRRLLTMGVRSRILGISPLIKEEEEPESFEAGGDQLIEYPFCHPYLSLSSRSWTTRLSRPRRRPGK